MAYPTIQHLNESGEKHRARAACNHLMQMSVLGRGDQDAIIYTPNIQEIIFCKDDLLFARM